MAERAIDPPFIPLAALGPLCWRCGLWQGVRYVHRDGQRILLCDVCADEER